MSNLFIVSPNTEIRVYNGYLSLNTKENKNYFFKKSQKLKIKLRNVRRIFILQQEMNLEKETIDTFSDTKNGPELFIFNNYGDLVYKILPIKKLKDLPVFVAKEHYKTYISEYIIKREASLLKKIIKTSNVRLKDLYSSLLEKEIYSLLYENNKINFYQAYMLNSEILYMLLKDVYPDFQRKYSSQDPINITVNFFHSLMFCFFTSWFINNMYINPYLSENFFLESDNNNYPAFIKAIFTQFRSHITLTALETFFYVFSDKDIENKTYLSKSGKLIITKIFSEKYLYNKVTEYKLISIWNKIQKINQGIL